MHSNRRLAWVGAIILVLSAGLRHVTGSADARAAESVTNSAATAVAHRVIRYRTSQGRDVFSISLDYSIPGVNSIFIDGLGRMASTGHIEAFTYATQLVFRETSTSASLLTLPLQETSVLGGGAATIDLPQESSFPSAYREETSQTHDYAAAKVLAVLNRRFKSGYIVSGDGFTTDIVTTFQTLDGLPDKVLGQVAISISYSPDKNAEFSRYKVRYIAQEGRSKSPTMRPVTSREVQRVSQEFVESVVREINR